MSGLGLRLWSSVRSTLIVLVAKTKVVQDRSNSQSCIRSMKLPGRAEASAADAKHYNGNFAKFAQAMFSVRGVQLPSTASVGFRQLPVSLCGILAKTMLLGLEVTREKKV